MNAETAESPFLKTRQVNASMGRMQRQVEVASKELKEDLVAKEAKRRKVQEATTEPSETLMPDTVALGGDDDDDDDGVGGTQLGGGELRPLTDEDCDHDLFSLESAGEVFEPIYKNVSYHVKGKLLHKFLEQKEADWAEAMKAYMKVCSEAKDFWAAEQARSEHVIL
jgi:hypothetical protein